MKRFLSIITTCALGFSIATIAPIAASAASAPQLVTITASSTSLFSPSKLTVHAGQPVEMTIIGQGGVHEIQSSELGIPETMIMPHSTKTVTFTPTKPGTYTLHCMIPCGPDHDKMAIVINVE